MNQNESFPLNFDPRRQLPWRAIFMAGILIGFRVIWLITPFQIMFWILIPFVGILGWLATYGWRAALRAVWFTISNILLEDLS